MNIFVTSADPIKCAEYLDDRRVNKMVLESAQLLSTAIYIIGGINIEGIKPTHINHPCAKWARASKSNFNWLYNHFCALLDEKSKRWPNNPAHSFERYRFLNKYSDLFSDIGLTPFVNCTTYKDIDTITAYRLYLDDKWNNPIVKSIPRWYGEE